MTRQVGAAADVAAEAVRCVDALRERLRKTARAVAGIASRPRVLLLESLNPITLGPPTAASLLLRPLTPRHNTFGLKQSPHSYLSVPAHWPGDDLAGVTCVALPLHSAVASKRSRIVQCLHQPSQ